MRIVVTALIEKMCLKTWYKSTEKYLVSSERYEIRTVTVNFEEINEIIAKSLGLLNHTIEEYKISSLHKTEN